MGGAGGGDKKIKSLVPIMTSDTTPSGVAFASSVYNSDYPAWHAFDGSETSSQWNSRTNESGSYIGYSFVQPVVVKSIEYIKIANASGYAQNIGIKFQGSNDQQNWTDLTSQINYNVQSLVSGIVSLANNTQAFTSYRMYLSSGSEGLLAREIKLFGYET